VFEKGLDSKGRCSLFGVVEFADDEAEKLKTRTNVSIYSPPTWTDGKDRKYIRPIRHVAFTNYPVVPDLDGFQVIAASFVPEEEIEMSMRSLAEKLGIEGDDARDDVGVEGAVVRMVNELKGQIKDLRSKLKEKDKPADKPDDKPVAVAASHVNMLEENRTNKVQRLVEAGKITPAVAEGLKEQYCGKERLTLCLSQVSFNDGFDDMMATLAKNEAVVKIDDESTGLQALSDPSIMDPTKNPLLVDAERRAKEAS
jgi:hypothetical protein